MYRDWLHKWWIIPTIHVGLLMSLSFGVSAFLASNGRAEDSTKRPYTVRFGTLEHHHDRERNYVFRWEGGEQVFDTSLNAFLLASGVEFPGLPDLKLVGFKTARGKTVKFGVLSPDRMERRFSNEHPGETIESLVFEGFLKEDLVVRVSGSTPVCRVDLADDGGGVTVLWKNLSESIQPVPASK